MPCSRATSSIVLPSSTCNFLSLIVKLTINTSSLIVLSTVFRIRGGLKNLLPVLLK